MTRIATRIAAIMLILGTTLLAGIGIGRAEVVSACGSLANDEGPFDDRSAPPKTIDLVQRHHSTESVAALQKGSSTIYIGAETSNRRSATINSYSRPVPLQRSSSSRTTREVSKSTG